MMKFRLFCLLALLTTNIVASESSEYEYDSAAGSDFIDVLSRVREKRTSVTRLAVVAIHRGAEAVQKLLNRARPIDPDGGGIKYKKKGNYDKAVKDFYSVDPDEVHVFEFSTGKKLRGQVGDRILLLSEKEAPLGEPVLTILRAKRSPHHRGTSTAVSNIIFYSD